MDLEQTIARAVDPANLRGHLEWFSQVRRDTGGPGEDAAAAYIADTLRGYGVPVTVHEFDAYLSYPREASLELLGDGACSFQCVTHAFARSTPEQGLEGEIVHATPERLGEHAGEIVLVDGLCTPITVLQASKAGVRALVFANQGDVVHNMIATTIWGTPTPDQLERLPELPVVSVNRHDGEILKQRIAAGSATVRMRTRVETGWYRSKLPEVFIPGREDADTFVLVGGHYCAWEVGITDNATGDAALLEIARILHEQRDELRRSVRICWWPGHSHGRYSGSTWYADTFFERLADGCIAYHNIDSPGVRGATMYVARHTTGEVEGFCKGVIHDLTGQGDPPVHRPSRAADQAFLANGVPAFSCYPFLPEDHPDRRPWTGGCANAWWWHSSEDTLDKADVDILALDVRISATASSRLCNAEVLPLDFRRVAEEYLEFAAELVEHAPAGLPVARFRELAEAFAERAGRLAEHAASKPRGEEATALNTTLMRLSRILTPVTFAKGGRFAHDPAEWSPIMRNTRSSVFPGLNAVASLPVLEGAEAHGFVRTGVLRQLNRAVDALREASAECDRLLAAAPAPSAA